MTCPVSSVPFSLCFMRVRHGIDKEIRDFVDTAPLICSDSIRSLNFIFHRAFLYDLGRLHAQGDDVP